MAKRMKFSVVGLPHYTIWHLYEPSLDDLRHMEEMEQEKKAREAEEKARAEQARQIKEEFQDTSAEWEKDGAAVQELIQQDITEQRQKAQNEKKDEMPSDEGSQDKQEPQQ